MKFTAKEAAVFEDEDDKFTRATQTLTDDAGRAQHKPGQSPKSISELLAAIECYIRKK